MKNKNLRKINYYIKITIHKFKNFFFKKKPIEINYIKKLLIENGVKKGDTLLIHSSLKTLMNSNSRQNQDSKLSPFEYSNKLINMLSTVVGDKGTILMPTEGIKDPLRFMYGNRIFDFRHTPSLRGLITEIFRRNKNSYRSDMPVMNLTGRGKLAKRIIIDHKLAAPYLIGKNSPWEKISKLSNAKVLLLGCNFDTNSIMRVPEAIFRNSYKGPIWFDKKIQLSYVDYNLKKKKINIYLRAIHHGKNQLERFACYLQDKYKIYKYLDSYGIPIRLYNANDQYKVLIKELKKGVWPIDANYWE